MRDPYRIFAHIARRSECTGLLYGTVYTDKTVCLFCRSCHSPPGGRFARKDAACTAGACCMACGRTSVCWSSGVELARTCHSCS